MEAQKRYCPGSPGRHSRPKLRAWRHPPALRADAWALQARCCQPQGRPCEVCEDWWHRPIPTSVIHVIGQIIPLFFTSVSSFVNGEAASKVPSSSKSVLLHLWIWLQIKHTEERMPVKVFSHHLWLVVEVEANDFVIVSYGFPQGWRLLLGLHDGNPHFPKLARATLKVMWENTFRTHFNYNIKVVCTVFL